jgi:tRNA (guanosine-2'-O-)-methyltransferase
VSVATATLLFESLRQRHAAGVAPSHGEGLTPEHYQQLLVDWSYPEVAAGCRKQNRPYPDLNEHGELMEELPRTVKLRC